MSFFRQLFQEAIRGRRVQIRSGFLALWCLESVVPVFALCAAAASAFGFQDAFLLVVTDVLGESIFGSTTESVVTWLRDVAMNASPGSMGVVGTFSALFLGYQLYVATLFDLGEVLHAGSSERGWLPHFALYPAFLVWVSVLLVGGVTGTVMMLRPTGVWMIPIVWLSTALCLGVGAKLFGRAPQSVRALLVGSVVGATWMELVKVVFVLYSTSQFGSEAAQSVYQQLAFAPLAMLWMHLVWFSLLLGMSAMEVAGELLDGDGEASDVDEGELVGG